MARRGGSGKAGMAVIALIGLIAFIAVVGFFVKDNFAGLLTKGQFSAANNCALTPPSPAHTVFLIDQSDPFSARDQDWVLALLRAEAQRLPEHGKMSIFALSRQPFAGVPIAPPRCSPGPAAQANAMTENVNRVVREYNSYLTSVGQEAASVTQPDHGNISPVIQALGELMRDVDYTPEVLNRRLVIVSDMIEFYGPRGGPLDFYHRVPDYSEIKDSIAPSVDQASLVGVCVTVRLVNRPNADVDNARLVKFWEDYFADRGTQVHWLQGATDPCTAPAAAAPPH